MKRKISKAILFGLPAIVFMACTSGTVDDDASSDKKDESSEVAAKGDDKGDDKADEPEMTKSQENALEAAENYLSFAPFSKKGLIRQLSSDAGDGYALADARFAANHVDVDWNEQAAKAAKNYLDLTPFSRDGLIQQLTSDAGDGYTRKQAEYGVTQAGL